MFNYEGAKMSLWGSVKKVFAGDPAKKKINVNAADVKGSLKQWKNNLLYYSGAGLSAGAKWSYGLPASGINQYINHKETRTNARKAVHSSIFARGIVERFADTVVDTGLVCEPAPITEILNITTEAAEAWAREVEMRFKLWCMSKNQHRQKTLSFYQAQRLYEIMQQRDNDMFVRLYYSRDNNLLSTLQFSFLDPNQIRGNQVTSTIGVEWNDDGIIRNEDGSERAYKVWIKEKDKDGSIKFVEKQIPKYGPKSKRLFMLHGFFQEYGDQGRGFSRLHHAIQEFESLTGFTSSVIQKAINHSMINMWVKPSKDAPASNPVEDILTGEGAGPASVNPATASTDPEDTGAIADPVTYSPIKEAVNKVPGAMGVFNLEAGEELKPFDSNTPPESYPSFVNSFVSYLCASTGMPVEVLLMKFSNNYSASRATLLMFWRVATIWRQEMATDFLNPVYEMWMAEEIAAARILAPGWSDPRLRAAWLNCSWVGAPLPNIDPQKLANANLKNVKLGATTLDRISRENNNSNGAANRMKLQREFSELAPTPWPYKQE